MTRYLRHILIVFLIMTLAMFTVACDSPDIAIVCDVTDGEISERSEYSFSARAVCGKDDCDLKVSFGGVLIYQGEDGKYSVLLEKGENQIKLTATHLGKTEERIYKVIYRAEFEIDTDISDAVIADGKISFYARASFNGADCPLIARINGETLKADGDSFTAQLQKGENIVSLTARHSDLTESKEWRVYMGEFALSTDLIETDTMDENLRFRVAASYDGQICALKVTLNGVEIIPVGNVYELTLQKGENIILMLASTEKASEQFRYKVNYINDPPKLETSIIDGKTYKGSKFGFDVWATDGLGKKLGYNCISFGADWERDGSFVPLHSVTKVWDDSGYTSFLINFANSEFLPHANDPFDLEITATDGVGRCVSRTFGMTYVPVAIGEKIGEVAFSLEGFSIGCGYFIKPCKLSVYEGVNFASILTQTIIENGWSYSSTGMVSNGFYLSGISGLDLSGNAVPEELWEHIPKSGRFYKTMPKPEQGEYELSEFCFAQGGGWMYSVNTVYKNYGFSDYYPQDGDVVRVQFTVWYGSDLGGGGAMGGSEAVSWLTDDPDYGDIMFLLAQTAEVLKDSSADRGVYDEVIGEISKWNISSATMAEQIKKLTESYGNLL